ncbi:universal stress protein [Adhaeribacter rhizoryzae]|uniref:Universal stress protein n=1 Tax=Adhaeribacter rhizoryzae TaxID=2607907 RepID=A0A5M6D114_9BACT|nr:universal stress protein [Adhaeribacter rhizoryzae]KAA5541164.1 universal stress protein [Adhaeribacter rhizoryzae]
MKNILVITDLSQEALPVLQFANKLAAKADAEIVLLHCLESEALTATNENRALSRLRNFAGRLHQQYPKVNATVVHNECVVRSGSLVSSVQDLVQDYRINLILMAAPYAADETENTQFFQAFLERVNCPILLVPAQGDIKTFNRISYAADFTRLDMSMLKRIISFARLYEANLDLVHVYQKQQRPYLAQYKKALSQLCVEVTYDKINFFLLEEDDKLEGINDFAEQREADLLVIATPDENLVKRLYSQKYLKTDAYHLHIPTIIYPEGNGIICSAHCPVCTLDKQRKHNLELVAL